MSVKDTLPRTQTQSLDGQHATLRGPASACGAEWFA